MSSTAWPPHHPPPPQGGRPSTDSQGYTIPSGASTPSHSDDGGHHQQPLLHRMNPSSPPSPPHSPSTPTASDPLLSPGGTTHPLPGHPSESPTPGAPPVPRAQPRSTTRSTSSSHYVPSRLNPNSPNTPISQYGSARSRPVSVGGSIHLNRIASEESHALGAGSAAAGLGPYPAAATGAPGHRASMVLYRLAHEEANASDAALVPPNQRGGGHGPRASVWSTASGASGWSMSEDSKYPAALGGRGIVAYAYNPDDDLKGSAPDVDDALHDVTIKDKRSCFGWRAVANIGLLTALILALLCLFVLYPVLTYYGNFSRDQAIIGNIHVNGSGQNPDLPIPQIIDPETPQAALTRTGYDGEDYVLVFSDEFNTDGRTFYPGDDPFWEAVDLWYWTTNDLEWYDPGQATTKDGKLVITMEERTNHEGMQYISGMLQSWNKFCFSSGYLEVAISLPGPDSNVTGYWPGAWTMGNLGRPGYGATTDGLWPYSYDECDVGTFPNQTYKDRSGPAAALHSEYSRSKYNYELSWLPGQRLSACTCSGEDHPGPTVSRGRGAPEIDVIEAEKNKMYDQIGQVVSQSAQFAPFTHDYAYDNSSADNHIIYDPSVTWLNSYRGSAIQQAMTSLTRTPEDIFQGTGQRTAIFGFEYWADPKNRNDGFITWVSDNKASHRMAAAAMSPDQGDGGSQVGQRIVPEEPMSIVLNLGISHNWQSIVPETMGLPGVMLVDYVRVYQRKGHENIGCNPKDYPTQDYINRHLDVYTNPNITGWRTSSGGFGTAAGYSWPKNSLYDGC